MSQDCLSNLFKILDETVTVEKIGFDQVISKFASAKTDTLYDNICSAKFGIVFSSTNQRH